MSSKFNSRQIVLILPNIRSLHNVGSVFRTADAFGVEKIYLCGYTGTPDSLRGEKISKVSLGAEKTIPWEYKKRPGDVIKKLKAEGWQIAALEQHQKSKPLSEKKMKNKVALILGNEVEGVSASILKQVDVILEIPMQGQKESLNVSVASGIALYALKLIK